MLANLLIAILRMLQVVVFVVLELTFVLWYLSAAAVPIKANLFPDNSKPVAVLAIRNTIETLPVS